MSTPEDPRTPEDHGTPEDHPLAQPVPRRPRDFGIDTVLLRRIRLISFAVLAIPLAVLTLLALKFVSLPLTQAWHDGAYQDEKYPTAIERLAPVEVVNWFEPYLPHLSRGTDLLQEGENAEAEKELRTALKAWQSGKDLNQPQHAQCKILNNLAISIERQADEITDAGERGDRLFEAEQLLAPCGGGGGGGDSSDGGGGGNGNEDSGTTGENGERVEKKRREADEEAGKDPDDRKADKPSEEEGEDEGEQGDEKGEGKNKTGDPRHDDPSGDGPNEEATTEGKDPEQQKKEDELEKRNEGANGGEGDESGGPTQEGDKPW